MAKKKAWRFGITSSVTGRPRYKLPKVRAGELKRGLEKMAKFDEKFYLRKTGPNLFTVFQKRKR